MKRKKTVSLIVLNYNGRHHLKEYFTSVFKQTYIPDEVIMFDNLSTDGSRQYVAKYFPKVKIFTEDRYNTGTANGSNVAFSHTTGDYVIFQSNDLRLDPHCIEELVKCIKRDKKIGICTSVFVRYEHDKKGHLIVDNAGGLLDKYGFGMQNYPEKTLDEIPIQGEVFFSYGSSFIIDRKLYKKLSGFDDRLFTLNEDIDFSWRVRLQGYKIIYTKKSFVYHKGSATLKLRARGLKRYWAERNSIRTFIKNSEISHLFSVLPMYLLILFGEIGYFLYRGKFSLFIADLRAVLWNLWYLPETLFMRYKIQSTKKKNNLNKLFVNRSFKLQLYKYIKYSL